ncbi:cilia- and flagella-associated protein 95-like [Oscarella lobularis]|uniref:cilia- and flagella-associated protein 95-like n=1 Tax=Oscarella lobularis TaxID=121494 RepID=UPI003313BE22
MDAFDPTVLPQFVERKGSLSLRSDHMKYGRATLISNWHQDRESEPKDYDIGANFDDRNLHKATYHHLATDKVKFETTTQASMDEIKLKKDFETRDTTRKMITAENALTNTQRDTGAPTTLYDA